MAKLPPILLAVSKLPASGQSKTRLGKTIGMDAAAAFARCLLDDTLNMMRQCTGILPAIAYLPEGSEAAFQQMAPDATLVLQQGASLNERLNHVLTVSLAAGHSAAGVLSCDTPFVSPSAVREAYNAVLGGADVALGPCDDGGWYLMVVREPHPELLLPITMSTDHVTRDTLEASAKHRLKVHMLPTVFDVDTFEDLTKLRNHLAKAPDDVAPHSRQWLHLHLQST
jgi:hypothetical protein